MKKITIEDVESLISQEFYVSLDELAKLKTNKYNERFKLVIYCFIVLKNGYTVSSESATIDKNNFNEEIGKKVARQKAIAKIFDFIAYERLTNNENN